jgi:hypothetical protein
MSIRDCQDCLTLWQEYLRAAARCIDLKTKQGAAAATGDVALFKKLDLQIDLAEESARRAKQWAHQHQRTQHPDEQTSG